MYAISTTSAGHDFDAGAVADLLVRLYDQPFGSRDRGRYRISAKHLRQVANRRRLYPEDIEAIERALFERGFILVDLESFFIVLHQKTFASYRRVNEGAIHGESRKKV